LAGIINNVYLRLNNNGLLFWATKEIQQFVVINILLDPINDTLTLTPGLVAFLIAIQTNHIIATYLILKVSLQFITALPVSRLAILSLYVTSFTGVPILESILIARILHEVAIYTKFNKMYRYVTMTHCYHVLLEESEILIQQCILLSPWIRTLKLNSHILAFVLSIPTSNFYISYPILCILLKKLNMPRITLFRSSIFVYYLFTIDGMFMEALICFGLLHKIGSIIYSLNDVSDQFDDMFNIY
jgi:uncharacterized membrane protein YkgB